MPVKAIYRLNPISGDREPAHMHADGRFQLVDRNIPTSFGSESNLRNLTRMSVRAKDLDEAAMLVRLGYAIRVKSTKNQQNYAYDVVIEER